MEKKFENWAELMESILETKTLSDLHFARPGIKKLILEIENEELSSMGELNNMCLIGGRAMLLCALIDLMVAEIQEAVGWLETLDGDTETLAQIVDHLRFVSALTEEKSEG